MLEIILIYRTWSIMYLNIFEQNKEKKNKWKIIWVMNLTLASRKWFNSLGVANAERAKWMGILGLHLH